MAAVENFKGNVGPVSVREKGIPLLLPALESFFGAPKDPGLALTISRASYEHYLGTTLTILALARTSFSTMTFARTSFSTMTLNTKKFSTMTLARTTFSTMMVSNMTFSIEPLSRMTLSTEEQHALQ
jgi:hypothetical protein